MKKIYLILCLIVAGSSAFSQSDLKPFKVDLSVGYAIPGGSGSKGGVLFVTEPKYAVMSNLAIGLRLEGALVARFNGYDQDGNPVDASVKASASYLATADYYFTNTYSVRPFAGAGVGIFTLAGIESSSNSGEISVGSKFGEMVRAGVEIGHFRLGIEYNIVPKTTFTGYDSDGNVTNGLTSKNSYIGIKIGVCLGGGPRK